ncbi:hypothetical protein GJ699_07865 [Duganella sp. FT80W]|uniref:Uncharacterized protein n=1 Tax=Duganella guangzhouensis TaxID=2666084 RepID=A0A6I2KV31_9BURK|nr:hypothetical protein [Duganella guangzhouensis]MRW89895.1 hypothetical protein [Duganella guangzhouensis]
MPDREELLPSPGLAARWLALLAEIRREREIRTRAHLSLSVNAWLCGLADCTLLTPAAFSQLQHVLLRESVAAKQRAVA